MSLCEWGSQTSVFQAKHMQLSQVTKFGNFFCIIKQPAQDEKFIKNWGEKQKDQN